MAFYLFDLDGTLALNNPRTHFLDPGVDSPCDVCTDGNNPDLTALQAIRTGQPMKCVRCNGTQRFMKKDWDAFFEACDGDAPNLPVIGVMMRLHDAGHTIEIWTGRVGSPSVTLKTQIWLKTWGIPPNWLTKMRPDKDHTPDHELKRLWLDQRRALGLPDPDMVFDDRNSVVAMWREAGLTCAQVAEGDF
jgi:hypothetical protein